jgi:alkanesulfonate monooxygenase SsuD/methylene tetrahydromethanopterin reductase-like flavin-dependent oxidoreductase (luciferase family)
MKFNFFHTMPWTHYEGVPESWPVSTNNQFDAPRAKILYDDYIETLVHAEACKFDWIAVNEHHFSPFSLMPNCNLMASIIAHRTKTAKIAILGNLVPLLNPIRVAEEYAMIDVMSGGRLVAGILRGIPHEYIAYNRSPDESQARMKEATELMIKCWTEPEPFGWEGEFYQFKQISIWPKPFQKPHPQILMSVSNPDAAALAAKHRAIMGMVFIHELGWARGLVDNFKKEAQANGWEAETDEKALEMMHKAHDYLHRVLMRPQRTAQEIVIQKTRFFGDNSAGQVFTEKLAKIRMRTVEESIEAGSIFCGSPDSVAKQIKKVHGALGNGIFSLNFKIGDIPETDVRRGMELFRDKVLPQVKDL